MCVFLTGASSLRDKIPGGGVTEGGVPLLSPIFINGVTNDEVHNGSNKYGCGDCNRQPKEETTVKVPGRDI